MTSTPVKSKESAPVPAPAPQPFWISRMREEFENLCERMGRTWPLGADGNGAGWRWGLNVQEKDDAIIVHAEAPGFTPEEIDIEANDSRLDIHAKKKEQKEEKGGAKIWRQSECYESISLPAAVNKDKVEARYENGILTIRLPKVEKAKSRKVAVTAN
jgi:HSP20 family protein